MLINLGQVPASKLSRVDLAYFAGLFDGEGSVFLGVYQRRAKTKSCNKGVWVSNSSLRLSNNDPIAFYELEKKFGGRTRPHFNKGSFCWTVQGFKATEFAELIVPYVRMKYVQLEIFLDFMYSKRKPGGAQRLSMREIKKRKDLVAELTYEKRKFNKNPGNNQYTLRRTNADQFGPSTGF